MADAMPQKLYKIYIAAKMSPFHTPEMPRGTECQEQTTHAKKHNKQN